MFRFCRYNDAMRNILVTLCCLIATGAALAETMTVSAAVSLKEAMEAVAPAFANKTGDPVQFMFGSSGQLAAQIQNGAPVDVFISAADKQVDDLSKANLLDDATRRVIAGNTLVLIAPVNSALKIDSFAQLNSSQNVKRIAVGEPKSVPAGQYAAQALAHFKLTEPLKNKLLFGTNVRQVLSYVERGEVDCGIVYSTDAAASGEKVRILATAPAESHEPIIYPAAVVRQSKNSARARAFLDFLLSDEAQATLRSKGFAAPPRADKK
jgi:molybdate transport system substrate-binding protein